MDVTDRVVVITGAEGGIGSALVRQLAGDGVSLVLGHFPSAVVEGGPGPWGPDLPCPCIPVAVDVSRQDSVAHLMDTALRRFGRIDAVVTLAGIIESDPPGEEALRTWDRIIGTNLTGTFLCCQAAREALGESGGAIVTVSSQVAFTGGSRNVAYAASKAGIVGLTRALARELGPRVRVNCVAPGPIRTPMTAPQATDAWLEDKARHAILGRIGEPEEVASAIRWLLGDGAAYVTGQTIHVNGGGVLS